MATLSEVIRATMTCGVFESEPSTRDRSVREMTLGPHHIWHRFPVPGGITGAQLMARNVSRSNPLLARLRRITAPRTGPHPSE